MISDYRDLEVWKKSMTLCEKVYSYVRMFPQEEKFALGDQLRRAVVSIPSNIAEGNGRLSQADYSHFLGIARGSLHEVCTQLELAERFGYITVDHETKELTTAIAKSSNYELYGDISRRIIQVLRERAVEIDHDFRTAEINFAPMKQG